MRGSERYARHERCVVENGCGRGCTSRLRHERLTRGYGLRELARMLGINETHLSRAERRQEGLSDRRKLQVARLFGLSVDDLFFSEPAGSEQTDHVGATTPAAIR
jgi:transcriptional regulator with XRE-family HTH domain